MAADTHDEAEWIEWKSGLDLSTKTGCFPIARTILGMANRLPASAALVCEGLGYIVVGAEPGNLLGVASVDPADLDQILEPWLGGVEGPKYALTYVLVDGKKVLVVVVEAPKNGDPIFTLRKEFDGRRDGEIFVRKAGRTDLANSADLKALTERASNTRGEAPAFEVSLVGDVPLGWFDPTTVDGIIAPWVASRRRVMESNARAEERRRHPDTTPADHRNLDTTDSLLANYLRQQAEIDRMVRDSNRWASMSGLAAEPDKRTLEEYLAEVEKWAERATNAGHAVLVDRYLRAGHGLVAIRVHNPSGRYLPKVMVEVHFAWDRVTSPKPKHPEPRLPTEPRPYGEQTSSALAHSMAHLAQARPTMAPSFGRKPARRSWTEKGSVKIIFNVGDLRQEGTDRSEEHHLFLPERPPDGILQGTWKATSPDVDGVIRGTLDVPVRKDPVDLQKLFEREPVGDDL